jgi:quinol monooxygenase YgiN
MAITAKAAIDAHPKAMRAALMVLHELILATAAETKGVGALVETLKWGEPAYLPKAPRVGTTVRINALKGSPDKVAVFFHCQTNLVASFRERCPDVLEFEGNRAIVLPVAKPLPAKALKHCIAMALTYHLAQAVAKSQGRLHCTKRPR